MRESVISLFDKFADERIIYVCAPAGFGKTAAVRQWLDKYGLARAAIPLNEHDNDINRFCGRLCAALYNCQPQNSALSEIISHPAFDVAPDEFTLNAISALSVKKYMALVLDDIHVINNEKVLGLLLVFLKRLPENCQIILISRQDLPPGFSDLWVSGKLVKITSEDLCFTNDEIMLLYKKRGTPITRSQADEIRHFTEGWAIAINALFLSGEAPISLKYLEEFILSNIWVKWDEQTREFMIRTAAAQELNPQLCDELAGVKDSAKMLRDLMMSGAFIYQTSNGVYQYHHLFHDFLRNMLRARGDNFLFPLLEKEGEWHLARQDFYSAAECFIRCRSHSGIAKCFDLLEVTDRNEFVIERMLPIIKNPEVRAAADAYPFLFFMLSWAAFVEGRNEDMTAYMDEYYARFPEIAQRDPAHAHNIFVMRLLDYRSSLRSLISDIIKLPRLPDTHGIRGSITMNMPLLHRGSRDFSELADENTETNIALLSDSMGWLMGEEANVLICNLAAGLLYEQGHLEKAYTRALKANAELKPHFTPELKFNAMSMLMHILDAMGDRPQAEQFLSRIQSVIESDRAYYLKRNFKAMRLRRKLENGDIYAARDWLSEYNADSAINCFNMYYTLTACRAYICVGHYDAAIPLLEKSLELVNSFGRRLAIIEIHILLSIVYWKKKRGSHEKALKHLEIAVSLAYEHRYTQIFIDNSSELSGMLRRLQNRAEQPGKTLPSGFIKLLCMNAMCHHGGGLTSGQPQRPEKYTDKQMAVMRLLCEKKSYRQMAEEMGIKLPTLRSHIALIYKKLGVTCASDAVTKINSSGILS